MALESILSNLDTFIGYYSQSTIRRHNEPNTGAE